MFSGGPSKIEEIAVRLTKSVRHMDVITYDPEGQRILKLITEGLYEAYNLAIPPDDGNTTHVTSAKDIEFEIKGKEGIKDAKVIQEAMPAHHIALCGICSAVHDPRQVYDHSSQPLRRTG